MKPAIALGFRLVARNAVRVERGVTESPPPTHIGEHRLCRNALLPMALGHGDDRFRRGGADASAVGTFITSTASFSPILEQALERRGVSRFVGIAGDVDWVGS